MNILLPPFIHDRHAEGIRQGSLFACTMFIDLSGFTALTERLMRLGTQGAEELSSTLHYIFQPAVQLVSEHGGFVPYFAGDSFTAIFPLDEQNKQENALQKRVLLLARQILVRFQKEQHGDGRLAEYKIGIKIGVSIGEVVWGIVGRKPYTFYFKGKAIDESALAQVKAGSFEMVCTAEFFSYISDIAAGTSLEGNSFYRLSFEGGTSVEEPKPITKNEIFKPQLDIYRQFLPVEVLESNHIGEFRSVTSVFISFIGIGSYEELDAFATIILSESSNFKAYFKEIDYGDKGGVVICLFGAPVSFENNVERALEFVAAIKDAFVEEPLLANLRLRVGVTSGVAFTGMVGGAGRSQYAAAGARVNLGARLMASAEWGETITDENVQRHRNFKFTYKGEIKYKGFQNPIPTFRLVGKNLENRTGFVGNYVDRAPEMQQLITLSGALERHEFGGVAYIYGEPGVGKSRLTFEFRKLISEKISVSWFQCSSDQILRKPFNPFIYFIKNYFDQKLENSYSENEKSFYDTYNELVLDLSQSSHPSADHFLTEIRRSEVAFAAIAGVPLAGSLWEQLDGRARYQRAIDALTAMFLAESILQPLVIELEDGHWFDEMSREALQNFVKKAVEYPILFVVTSRYEDDGSKTPLFQPYILAEIGTKIVEIDLNVLQPEMLKTFVESRLGGAIHPDLLEMMQRMTQGNPFYAEQMVEYFKETALLSKVDGVLQLNREDIQISNSVKDIMMSRIDRLSSMVKETVKAAAVIGREFELPVLSEVMARQEDFRRKNGDLGKVLKEQIQSAEKWQIWSAMNELRYIFRHSLLREAAYDMQLRVRLRELHKMIGEAIEKLYPENEERFIDLAFHFEQSNTPKKTLKYLEKAAKYAQKNFQNRLAIQCYDKLLQILTEDQNYRKKVIKILLRRGTVSELVGEWSEAENVYLRALEVSTKLQNWELLGRSNRRLGHLYMLKGNYVLAARYLDEAMKGFLHSKDDIGLAKTYGDMGTLFFRQGIYSDAQDWFRKAIDINRTNNREVDNAPIASSMGLIAMNLGNYDEGIRILEHQLDISEAEKDKTGLITLYSYLGIIYSEKGNLDNARKCLEKGLTLSEELGNKLFMTICIGSLGAIWQKKGDFVKAEQLFVRDLALCNELGDKQGISIAHGLLGELLCVKGDFTEAEQHLQRNVKLARELNYKKGLAKALNNFGDMHYHKKEYQLSAKNYEEAIQLCREIGNKPLLSQSLLECGLTYFRLGHYEKTALFQEEGRQLANLVQDKGLICDAQFLSVLLISKESADHNIGDMQTALSKLKYIAEQPDQEAGYHYLRWWLDKNNADARSTALQLYQSLYENTPHILYKSRIEELSS